ncbi:hypothetical protein AQ505_19135 [Pedobacter sp. PACM 27299]|uniref:hypothetical protein n=1 Tax=Pedobacter sp. PACM 27299 TaxID=1727164 RepID=UPI0007062278|nr:hypothetical protein [Pedobacter sp. PACM 27299]ALL07417.1 hypothetical protein AQ505_19135 [Pedobacter sp. PACM 27299]
MKTKFKTLSLIAITFILFALPFSSSAASFALYLCGGATAGLIPDAAVNATLKNGDKIMWQEFDAAGNTPIGSPITVTVAADATPLPFTVGSGLSVGAHYFKVFIIAVNPNNCSGDLSDPFSLYVLPTAAVAIGTPSQTSFCEANSNPTTQNSVLTATATALDAALTDVTYAFTWTATKDAAAVTDVTTIGAIGPVSPVNVNTFTLNNTAGHGAYIFKAGVKYVIAPGNGVLKSPSDLGCPAESAASATITVTPKPGKPGIQIAS